MTRQIILVDAYCIDTSALIDFWRDYPHDVFEGLWRQFEGLVRARRIVAPDEVFAELEQKDDELLEWVKAHRSIFRPCDAEQLADVQKILSDLPTLVDPDKTVPEADPFVVAMGKNGYKIVTSEGIRGPGGRPTIRSACGKYKIECLSLLEFFRRESWHWPP